MKVTFESVRQAALSLPGVEEEGLFVVDEVLVERKAGGSDFGNQSREAVDTVGDFGGLCVHADKR